MLELGSFQRVSDQQLLARVLLTAEAWHTGRPSFIAAIIWQLILVTAGVPHGFAQNTNSR